MKIVVDAMGGDYAPDIVIEGALKAYQELGVEIILTGDENKIRLILKQYKNIKGISIHHTSEAIEMNESAALSVRKKRDSSIVVGLQLVKAKYADAFVSAGNTGAVVCAATLTLGLLEGVERPGIAIIVPTLKEPTFVLDVGANIDPKPLHLLQYAIMSNVYMRDVFERKNPSIGLLNIGEEEAKGTDFMKETHQLLGQAKINFIGNVEGKDIFTGKVDAIICDGFVGNVALKVMEGVAEMMGKLLRRELMRDLRGRIGIFLVRHALGRFKKHIDYAEYGGAPLLGVNGTVIIGHGRSNVKAIKNAIRAAKIECERKVNEKIVEEIRSLGAIK